MCRAGVEPAQQLRVGYGHLGSPVPSRHMSEVRSRKSEVSTLDGIRTHVLHRERVTTTPGWSARAIILGLPLILLRAPSPFAFCPPSFPMAQVGFEPTASLGLSKSGLPVAYRAVKRFQRSAFSLLLNAPAPGVGVEPTSAGSKPASLTISRPRNNSGGRRGSRTLKAHRSAVFETAAIAGWLALPLDNRTSPRSCVELRLHRSAPLPFGYNP